MKIYKGEKMTRKFKVQETTMNGRKQWYQIERNDIDLYQKYHVKNSRLSNPKLEIDLESIPRDD